jgi:hypothetical protein
LLSYRSCFGKAGYAIDMRFRAVLEVIRGAGDYVMTVGVFMLEMIDEAVMRILFGAEGGRSMK